MAVLPDHGDHAAAVTTKALGQRLRPWLRYLSAAHIAELRRAPAGGRPPAVIVDSVCCRPGHEGLFGALLRDTFLQFRRLEPGCVLTIAWAHGATAAIAEHMRWEALGPFGDQAASGEPPIARYIQRDWAAGFDTFIEGCTQAQRAPTPCQRHSFRTPSKQHWKTSTTAPNCGTAP